MDIVTPMVKMVILSYEDKATIKTTSSLATIFSDLRLSLYKLVAKTTHERISDRSRLWPDFWWCHCLFASPSLARRPASIDLLFNRVSLTSNTRNEYHHWTAISLPFHYSWMRHTAGNSDALDQALAAATSLLAPYSALWLRLPPQLVYGWQIVGQERTVKHR